MGTLKQNHTKSKLGRITSDKSWIEGIAIDPAVGLADLHAVKGYFTGTLKTPVGFVFKEKEA